MTSGKRNSPKAALLTQLSIHPIRFVLKVCAHGSLDHRCAERRTEWLFQDKHELERSLAGNICGGGVDVVGSIFVEVAFAKGGGITPVKELLRRMQGYVDTRVRALHAVARLTRSALHRDVTH
ncbi:MAG: hypothetical protein Q7S20_13640 [Gemmatimonadaceae bacterium]|nr:hypothetical protein [Gemmatimonadaceae bacterium]